MPDHVNTLGDRIKQVRGDMSQDEFASRLAVHKETLGKYERNKRQPDAGFLARMRDEFNVSVDWLITGWIPPPNWNDGDARTKDCGQVSPSAWFQPQALIQAIDLVETWLSENGRSMTPTKKAEVIGFAYEILTESNSENQGTAHDNIVRLLKVAS